jgi:CRP/FNR family cyclic AMP-dependent transcriptional regulator
LTNLAERRERLRSIKLFSTLEDEALALVASLGSEIKAPAGSVLTHPNQPGAGMFVIEDGNATVELRGGKTRWLGPGDCFGELALLTPEGERTARVRAETDLRCFAIPREDFQDLLEREPRIAVALLPVLASRLADT